MKFALVVPTVACALFLPQNAFSNDSADDGVVITEQSIRSETFRSFQRERVAERIADLRKERKETDDEDDLDDIDDELEILSYVSNRLAGQASSSADYVRRNVDAARILDSLSRDEDVQDLPPFNELFRNVVLGTLFGHGVPLIPEKRIAQPAGNELAAMESWFLYDSKKAEYYRTEELAKLTPLRISALDIGPHHPEWMPRAEASRLRRSRISSFENEMERRVIEELRRDGDLDEDESYQFESARRVLFFKKMEQSATSPKADTEDAFGVEWKLKWGDEPAVEPVASRLYLLTGARTTDLVFANPPGHAGVTLVLEDEGSVDPEDQTDEERDAETFEQLSEAVLDLYGFDIAPYVLDHGTITEENLGSVLSHLPSGGKKKYRPGNLIGRQWVTFRESSVELKPKGAIRREDGANLSDAFAIRDRVGRALYLFDLWVENRDVKYDNRKAYYLRSGGSVIGYREAHHDLGLSLGGLLSSGETNRLRAGSQFSPDNQSGQKARFKAPLIFKPEAWKQVTWTDARWMAENIAAVDEALIREAVAESLWPDFVQETLVYRLMNRRARIVETFGVELSEPPLPAIGPTIRVPLSTDQQVAEAEQKYGLPQGALTAELASTPGRPRSTEEVIVRNGVIADGRNSALVRALVRNRYPSGLAKRYKRRNDKAPPEIRSLPE